jgi:hypothetical protein
MKVEIRISVRKILNFIAVGPLNIKRVSQGVNRTKMGGDNPHI